jgi:hypothetical protein
MTTPDEQHANDEAGVQYWLAALRDGDVAVDGRIHARAELAVIYERQGKYADATNHLLANVQEGAMSAEILGALTRLRRAGGRGDQRR